MRVQRTMQFFIYALIVLTVSVAFTLNSVQAATSTTFKVQKRFLYIQPGQSVFSIVKVLYPDKKNKWSGIIKQIVKKNPHAFENREAARIIVGQRIELPALASKIKPVVSTALFTGKESVGQIIQARGKRFAISAKNKKRELDIGEEIYVGDRIYTGVDGFLRLSMIDDAKIDLRCNSEVVIEDYKLMRAGNRSIIYLIKGSLRKITGSIGKFADDVYEMKTPMSTVGVRGTDYALRVSQAFGCDGSIDVNSKGLFVKVNSGAIDLKNKSGSVGLTEGDAAHVTGDDQSPQSIKVGDGVFDKASEDEDDGVAWWWWLLGIIAIAAA
jgi:FecR protein